MRKVVVSEFVSLDGVMEDPMWTAPFFGEEQQRCKLEELLNADTLVLGRVTYEAFAAAWPSLTDEQGFAARMNSLPKFVVSNTLQELAWNNSTLIQDNIAEEIAALKHQPGEDILVYGSGQLVQSLLQQGVIDEFRLMTFPVVLGSGKKLFPEGSMATLKLVDTTCFSTGAIELVYHPQQM
ncbi:dihydrofolate reductase [Hymenobacter lutimineralis]|uniref:Dihydrofolate reductase n=1 Tax=Hymenobacter lutimineralis TaxID=2606448 RepID=A0A5D6VBG9_9BACT|nr:MULTISPECIES: dihydrofolate reductase family protein [Hymenobacter]QIX61901.1 dihydrofolate reductase [Hymenobacter sp. BT18]TYZ12595.1 dihydrofolate reductase [Hymenobacter lutimineralis]